MNLRRLLILKRRAPYFPILITAGILVIAMMIKVVEEYWVRGGTPWVNTLFYILSFLSIAVITYLISYWLHLLVQERTRLDHQLELVEQQKIKTRQRLDAIFQINQKYIEANDEKDVINFVLQHSVEMIGAQGASFVPLDEYHQPMTAIHYGEQPIPVLDAWVEYLASPSVRDQCSVCDMNGKVSDSTCPILKKSITEPMGLYCFRIRRGGHEFGVLNLYMRDSTSLDEDTQSFLRAITDETALAIESVRLRSRELAALRQVQRVGERVDLSDVLDDLLTNVYQNLDADFAVLVLRKPSERKAELTLTKGDYPTEADRFIHVDSGDPLLLGDVSNESNSDSGVWALLVSPLVIKGHSPLGALLMGNQTLKKFHPRQLALLETIAGQIALTVDHAKMVEGVKYNSVIQERTRLAREIHDGLAQSLGLLKLQLAQMQNYLTQGDIDRLEQMLTTSYQIVSDTYIDAREAIDDLRIKSFEGSILSWLRQTISEFEDTSGIPVILENVEEDLDFPVEVQIQIIRIVQEALSNIRKHADASQVEISCYKWEKSIILEVCDDGRGFSSDEVHDFSRHGQRGMQERSDLIGADFQIISQPQKGTVVRVSMPLNIFELGVSNQ